MKAQQVVKSESGEEVGSLIFLLLQLSCIFNISSSVPITSGSRQNFLGMSVTHPVQEDWISRGQDKDILCQDTNP